jgi:tetratricopeptide (TPR) repeat protein
MLRIICISVACFLLCGNSYAQLMTTRDNAVNALHNGDHYLSQFKAKEAFARYDSAVYYAGSLDDDYLLAKCIIGTGQALWYMCQFTTAVDSVNRGIFYLRRSKNAGSWELPAALRVASNLYDQLGDYVKAFETVTESVKLSRKGENDQNIVLTLVQLGHIYYAIGDFATARLYYSKGEELRPEPMTYGYRELHRQIGILYTKRQLFDSALYHYQLAIPGHPFPRNIHLRIGESYLMQGKLDSAYRFLQSVYPGALEMGDAPILTPAMIGLGKIYLSYGQLDSALYMAKGAFEVATEKGTREIISDASLLLSEVYEQQKDSQKAFLYYKQYKLLRDSVLSEQLRGQLYSFKRKTDNERQESQLRLLKWGFIALAVIAIFIIVILLLRHKTEKLKMQQRSAELKMQALRAQMNPHFIFNCLSAINHFILNSETDKASGYLTQFARLIRLVLVNSEKKTISLEEELVMLKLYLEMEKLRFKDAFDYHIIYDAAIQPSMIEVPSFILQPFCENAIWHGLLHKEGKGELIIDLSMKGNVMITTITDNGVGREKAAQITTRTMDKQGSFGLSLTTERLALFNNETKAAGSFLIEDIVGENGEAKGTRVILSIKNKAV